MNLAGAKVSWKSKRQTVVASSSTYAEYIALCLAAQEAIWLRSLHESLSFQQSKATKLYEDNQGATALTTLESKDSFSNEAYRHKIPL